MATEKKKNTAHTAKSILSGHDALYVERAILALPHLVKIAKGKDTETYTDFARRLDMRNVRNLNYVLGCVGQTLVEVGHEWRQRLPPIQALICNKKTRLPGQGFEASTLWRRNSKASKEEQDKFFRRLRERVYSYRLWPQVLARLEIGQLTEDAWMPPTPKQFGKIRPARREVISNRIERDPRVREATLRRAKYKCEIPRCSSTKQFRSLDVHHITHLGNQGSDHIYNTIALCPCCHARVHRGCKSICDTMDAIIERVRVERERAVPKRETPSFGMDPATRKAGGGD